MFLIRDFIRNNPQAIVIGPVPIAHLIEKLEREYKAELVSPEVFRPYQIQMQRENAYYYALDEQMNVPMEEIRLKAVRIPVTDQTRHYTEKDFVRWNLNDAAETDDIFVVYEEKTGYFYCNSSMLHLEIKLATGLSQTDVDQKTEKYTEYLGLMQRYIETYTDFDHLTAAE